MPLFIWIKGKKYYKYETYNSFEQALNMAKAKKKRDKKCKYFIQEHDAGGILGYIAPHTRYTLYLNRLLRIGF